MGITMMATAAGLAGVGGRVVSAAEVVEACEGLLAHAVNKDGWWDALYLNEDSNGGNPYGLDQSTFQLLTLLSVARLSTVVNISMDPTARLYFPRVHVTGGQPVAVEWPLGALATFHWEDT